jgi:uncharacterized coiled-coil DUF342 family protein
MERGPFLRRRMVPEETPGSSPADGHGVLQRARETRWRGQEFADITKLRELSAKHERLAAKSESRAARLATRIEKLRHQATLQREKAQKVLGMIPGIEQQMAQHERDIKSATERTGGVAVTSDVTSLHYRIRKLQQKIVDLQHKSRTLEHRASQKTQKTSELKIKADRYHEQARLEELEAQSCRQRADRLQLASESSAPAVSDPRETPRDTTGPA